MRNLFLLEMRSYIKISYKEIKKDEEKKYCALLRSWTLDLEHLSPAWTSLQNIAPLCQIYPLLLSRSSKGAHLVVSL